MARNTETEFLVDIKFGDRVKNVVVRSPGIFKDEEAKAHIKKLQDKGKMFRGEITGVKERPRSNANRPAALDKMETEGIQIHGEGATTDAV